MPLALGQTCSGTGSCQTQVRTLNSRAKKGGWHSSRKKPLANNVDPDETPHHAASHQGLRCLLKGISVIHAFMSYLQMDVADKCWNRILKAFANSLDPDETPQNVAMFAITVNGSNGNGELRADRFRGDERRA
ncbi:hypothetical protein DPMN_173117 [Dreissena polymorpha]|uniref:Uncharacterized protein n=1 Tax=Dreissena polymorpha TaxID=45954 RepID=A0A9D4E297_DREPO|nr:hypothetical protein DPMN_173117 [Dreissena polymorpha]